MTLFYIFLATQVVDAWSTWQVFRLKNGIEANPLVARLILHLGLFWGLAAAKGSAVGIVALGQFYGAWNGDLGRAALVLLIGFYAWVLWNNLRILYGR